MDALVVVPVRDVPSLLSPNVNCGIHNGGCAHLRLLDECRVVWVVPVLDRVPVPVLRVPVPVLRVPVVRDCVPVPVLRIPVPVVRDCVPVPVPVVREVPSSNPKRLTVTMHMVIQNEDYCTYHRVD